MTSRAEKLYRRLPTPLQHVAITAYGYGWRRRRMGGRFAAIRDSFAARNSLTADDWRDWQTRRLRYMLSLAAEAPYYQAQWRAADVEARDVARVELADLQDFPLLTKEAVRVDPTSLCPGGRPPRGALAWHTSGSTGTPLVTYFSRDDFRRGMAVRDARYGAFAGVDFTVPRATFSGRRVEPNPESTGPFHRYNGAERQVYFSPYHLGPATVSAYVHALWRHRPLWLTGYAGAIAELARLAVAGNIACPPLRAVITAAEPVPDDLRDNVRRAFRCRAHEEYGLIEEVAHAMECRHGSLHVSPDAGIVEILDEEGNACAPGTVGEIVGTSLLREAQPFVRYRTGDLGTWAPEPCTCGSETPVLAMIVGRLDDVVVGTDGRRVGRLSTVPKELPGVVATQFVQRRAGAIEVRVVCDGTLSGAVAEELRRRLRDRIGSDTEVSVAQVPELEKTANGKVRGVISTMGGNGEH